MRKGRSLEKYIQEVYDFLLNLKNEECVVEHDVKLKSSIGVEHQIDVYYEFKQAGITHKVAIECKDTARPLEKGKVQEFESKLRDLNGVTGVIVSANGYQKSAITFGKAKGIHLLTLDSLPSLVQLIGMKLEFVSFPEETDVGEPLWAIMEKKDGKLTGHYHYSVQGSRPIAFLFLSKGLAKKIFNMLKMKDSDFAVRGLRQQHLRGFLAQHKFAEKKYDAKIAVGYLPITHLATEQPAWFDYSSDELIEEYADFELIEE